MTPQEKQEFEKIKNDLANLMDVFYSGDFPDKKVFSKKIVTDGGIDLTGTVVVGEVGGYVSLYGETPVTQAAAITAPSGGATVDSQARTAINSILTALTNIGITA